MGSLIAGAKYGEFEDRLRAVPGSYGLNGQIVLFIDELHTVVGTGGTTQRWMLGICSNQCWHAGNCAALGQP